MTSTLVIPRQLNYDSYTMAEYDRGIVNSVPYHKEIHQRLQDYIAHRYRKQDLVRVLDLGVGTGLSSQSIQRALPHAHFDVVDFSQTMLGHARRKLGSRNIRYIMGDYSQMRFSKGYDIIMALIGLHHQSDAGKKRLFKKIYASLKPGGVFVLGDLVTYHDLRQAAYNQALHFYELVKHAESKKMLTDWAYHHAVLNKLTPLENLVAWLRDAGFSVAVDFCQINTALLICRKPAR